MIKMSGSRRASDPRQGQSKHGVNFKSERLTSERLDGRRWNCSRLYELLFVGFRRNNIIVAVSARFLFGVQVMFPPGELLQGLSQF